MIFLAAIASHASLLRKTHSAPWGQPTGWILSAELCHLAPVARNLVTVIFTVAVPRAMAAATPTCHQVFGPVGSPLDRSLQWVKQMRHLCNGSSLQGSLQGWKHGRGTSASNVDYWEPWQLIPSLLIPLPHFWPCGQLCSLDDSSIGHIQLIGCLRWQ